MIKISAFAVIIAAQVLLIRCAVEVEIEFRNKENITIVVAIQPTTGSDLLEKGGFVLESGKTRAITVPTKWFGYIWGRTHCNLNSYKCLTGNCDSGLECSGESGDEPHSYAIFKNNNGLVQYDITVSRGFNVPIYLEPELGDYFGDGGELWCKPVGCKQDLNDECPEKYRVIHENAVIGCKTPCKVHDTEELCCRGKFKETCHSVVLPDNYEKLYTSRCKNVGIKYFVNAKFSCRVKKFYVTFGTLVPLHWV